MVVPENLVINNRPRVVGLATKYRLPTIYGLPEFVQDGGLISTEPTCGSWRVAVPNMSTRY